MRLAGVVVDGADALAEVARGGRAQALAKLVDVAVIVAVIGATHAGHDPLAALGALGDPGVELRLGLRLGWGEDQPEAGAGGRGAPEAVLEGDDLLLQLRHEACLGGEDLLALTAGDGALALEGAPGPVELVTGAEEALEGWPVGGGDDGGQR